MNGYLPLGWTLEQWREMRQTHPRDVECAAKASMAQHVRATLGGKGFVIPAGDSPIIPVILGAEERALAAAEQLREAGLWVVAIRPPTVPRGGSRLRLTLSCEHTDEQVNRLIEALMRIAG